MSAEATLDAYRFETQLQMGWPAHRLQNPPAVRPPPGYVLRTYRPGAEPRFFEIMEQAGWPGWDDETLQPWRSRILPRGWFMAVHEAGRPEDLPEAGLRPLSVRAGDARPLAGHLCPAGLAVHAGGLEGLVHIQRRWSVLCLHSTAVKQAVLVAACWLLA